MDGDTASDGLVPSVSCRAAGGPTRSALGRVTPGSPGVRAGGRDKRLFQRPHPEVV